MRRFAKILADTESDLKSAGEDSFENRVVAYRKALRVEEKWLELQHRRISGGLEVGRMRADTIDDFLRHLMTSAVEKLGGRKPPKWN